MLKRIFEGMNYKDGPFAVGKFWACQAVWRWRDSSRSTWYIDHIKSDEDYISLAKMSASSRLAASLAEEPISTHPYALRSIESFSRERTVVCIGDWVLVETGDVRVIACVREMVEALITSEDLVVGSFIRLLCVHCAAPQQGNDGEIWTSLPDTSNTMVALLEDVHISVLTRHMHEKHAVYS